MSTITRTSTSTRHACLDTGLGALTVVRDDDGLTGLYFPGHRTDPDPSGFGPRTTASDPLLAAAADQLGEYLDGARRSFDLLLAPRGTRLEQRVWDLLRAIPFGVTTTYGALADQVGGGVGPRAIGGLVGRNPLSIVVACHRVVGAGGALTGYAGGLDRKRRLLELEGALPASTAPLW